MSLNELNQIGTSSRRKSGKVTTLISRKNINIIKCITPKFNQQKIIFGQKSDSPSKINKFTINNSEEMELERGNNNLGITRNVL